MQVIWSAARENAGLYQREVCEAIGVGMNTLIDWEKYRKHPDVVQAQKLCKLYGCTLQDIIFDKSEQFNIVNE